MPERRRFNEREHAALWVAAGGSCVLCGAELDRGWHADHVAAFGSGGETDVVNGQALCRPCNLKKGDGAVLGGGWPSEWPLRSWQEDAFLKFTSSRAQDFLVLAAPGSGKTALALRIAQDALQQGIVARVVVIVPTDHLRRQWALVAASAGIQLQDDFTNSDGWEAKDYDGLVTTYASVASAPLVYRTQCRRRTLVVFDEGHHMGDLLTWGKAAQQAFEPAIRRLMLSGTPWREDQGLIPFVQHRDGLVVADHTYTYSDAIADGVCRSVMFPRFDGEMRWQGRRGPITATFLDEIPEDEASRRLRTALDARNQWLPDVLTEAHDQLMELRTAGYPSAGGLVCCIDQDHARSVAHLLRGITGRMPSVALSDDGPQASETIARFGDSADPWIVAVRMISEGVDISRLVVGVYASNVISYRTFTQFIGRFTRVQQGAEDLFARVNVPNDPTFAMYAAHVSGEVEDGLAELIRRAREEEDDEKQRKRKRDEDPSPFTPGWSGPAEFVGVTTVNGGDVPVAAYDQAKKLAADYGRTSREDILFLAQVLASVGQHAPLRSQDRSTPADDSVNKRRKKTRGTRELEARKLGMFLKDVTGRGDAFKMVNTRLMRLCGNVGIARASVEDHLRAIGLVHRWIEGLAGAKRENGVAVWVAAWEQGAYDGDPIGATHGA